jgi:hypothetical protein
MTVACSKIPYPLLMFFLVGTAVLLRGNLYAVELDFQGQLSGWTTETKTRGSWENFSGILYIPQARLAHDLDEASTVDAELSVNSFAITGSGPYEDEIDLELYRATLRYATAQTETRAGLQKISFGPAQLLRPLRWFDSLNPADPLQLTEGVYAMRFRYTALNNANAWLWGLYGNDDPKGYEILPTASGTVEVGGRFQYPIFSGEMAATLHTRTVDGSQEKTPDFRENRFALDGRWDTVIGLWFESTFEEQRAAHLRFDWTKRITGGIDYTFDMGNGLYVLFEHMVITLSDRPFGWDEDMHVSAFSMNYPVGVMDTLTAIGYYSWDHKEYYQYLNWKRMYDSLTLSVSLFYYPEEVVNDTGFLQYTPVQGRGGQVMLIFNH